MNAQALEFPPESFGRVSRENGKKFLYASIRTANFSSGKSLKREWKEALRMNSEVYIVSTGEESQERMESRRRGSSGRRKARREESQERMESVGHGPRGAGSANRGGRVSRENGKLVLSSLPSLW